MTASTDLGGTLANIRARAEAATPGPWEAGSDGWTETVSGDGEDWSYVRPVGSTYEVTSQMLHGINDEQIERDHKFIAHARTDIELLLTLLDQVATQRDEIQANRDALAHKVAEQRAVIARVHGFADAQIDEFGQPYPWRVHLLAQLDGADTTTTDGSEA